MTKRTADKAKLDKLTTFVSKVPRRIMAPPANQNMPPNLVVPDITSRDLDDVVQNVVARTQSKPLDKEELKKRAYIAVHKDVTTIDYWNDRIAGTVKQKMARICTTVAIQAGVMGFSQKQLADFEFFITDKDASVDRVHLRIVLPTLYAEMRADPAAKRANPNLLSLPRMCFAFAAPIYQYLTSPASTNVVPVITKKFSVEKQYAFVGVAGIMDGDNVRAILGAFLQNCGMFSPMALTVVKLVRIICASKTLMGRDDLIQFLNEKGAEWVVLLVEGKLDPNQIGPHNIGRGGYAAPGLNYPNTGGVSSQSNIVSTPSRPTTSTGGATASRTGLAVDVTTLARELEKMKRKLASTEEELAKRRKHGAPGQDGSDEDEDQTGQIG